MFRIIAAVLALLPIPAFALTVQCRSYEGWHDNALKLEERDMDYVLTSGAGTDTFAKTVSKRFGHLIDAGVLDGQEHTFVHDSISGIPVIIVDGLIFTPTCYTWDKKAPKAELAPGHLWFLSPKKWP